MADEDRQWSVVECYALNVASLVAARVGCRGGAGHEADQPSGLSPYTVSTARLSE